LIFIDAQKSGYPSYLKDILAKSQPGAATRLLRQGGLIVADNVLRRGLVADDSEENPNAETAKVAATKSEYQSDRDLEYLREYNAATVSSPRLESVLLPLYDGLAVSRLLD
jgi:predicted O-methyltransferase YrrM